MNIKILTTASALALMAITPVLAAETKANNAQSTGSVSEDAKKAWKDIKTNASEAYEDFKATVLDEKNTTTTFSTVTINTRMTATGMIGRSVYNEAGESVAMVKDIIVDDKGKAMMIVVADGEFIGMGKKAAFDYNAITRINADGDIIMPLTEQMIDNAAEFSYDPKATGEKVRVIPSNGYSVAALLDGQLVNQNKEVVAQIDNITFKNGYASMLIVGFDKILGMGGEKLAMNYTDVKMIPDGTGYDFQLSTSQAVQFDAYKKTVTN